MTEISHFLRPGGWTITRLERLAAKILPKQGSTILIGRAQTGRGCRLAWLDATGGLRILERLVLKRGQLETTFRLSGQDYLLTVKAKGSFGIEGTLQTRLTNQVGGQEMSGTWGAEAGGGGSKAPVASLNMAPNPGSDMSGTYGSEAGGGGKPIASTRRKIG
jgi:hypothetical protein